MTATRSEDEQNTGPVARQVVARGVRYERRGEVWVPAPNQGPSPDWWRSQVGVAAPDFAGAEWGARCRCGGRLVYRGAWWCVDGACGRVPMVGYAAASSLPRGIPAAAAVGVPLFRSQIETNCDSEATSQRNRWISEVEWLTSWSRQARAGKLLVRGTRGSHVSPWHQDRRRGVGERFERVRRCGALTEFEWVERDGSGRFPHREECGQWRVCQRCLKRRRKRLRQGVEAQRMLALAVHRHRLNRHYAGPEGRWTERLLTLTVPHDELARDVAALPKAWRALEAPWRRHLKDRGAPQPQVYVRSIEVAGTGHAHMHVWMLGPYIEHALIRVWWGAALEAAGYVVPRRALRDVVLEARDKRTAGWLAAYVRDGMVPWPVLDVRAGSRGGAARYATKVGAAVALYSAKQGEYVELEPVHAARVYEALEGVRVTQWSRGWAPPRERSGRWLLRRVNQVATALTEREGVAADGVGVVAPKVLCDAGGPASVHGARDG